MGAGKYAQRVSIERPTGTRNATGEQTDAWELVRYVWAEVMPMTGREAFRMAQVAPLVTHTVKLRYQAGITSEVMPKHRVKYSGRVLQIESVINVAEANKEIELRCVEAVDEQ